MISLYGRQPVVHKGGGEGVAAKICSGPSKLSFYRMKALSSGIDLRAQFHDLIVVL